MAMDLHEQPLGSEGNLKLSLVEGKVALEVLHKSKALEAVLNAKVDPDYFIDQLKTMIPGEVDDAIFEIIKSALKAV